MFDPQKASESHLRQIADMSPIRIVETEVPSSNPRQDLSLVIQLFMKTPNKVVKRAQKVLSFEIPTSESPKKGG